jgi:tetratricopeptide (TPR) repeat protein
LGATANGQSGTPQTSADRVLAQARLDILSRDFTHAVRILKKALKQNPENASLRVALGRAYLYEGRHQLAIRQFRAVLRGDPQNRLARLELARALADSGHYRASSEIYRAMLADNPADEAAAIGLTNNLIHQKQAAEAMSAAQQGLKQHPESLVLQELQDRIRQGEFGGNEDVIARRNTSLTTSVNFIDDSIGNRSLDFSQLLNLDLTHHLHNELSLNERRMTGGGLAPAGVASGMDTLRYSIARWAAVHAGGGAVRFGDGTSRSLYDAGLDIHPLKSLWLGGSYSRTPFYPDVTASGYDLTAEGWRTLINWRPGPWRVNAWWWHQHYTDGNMSKQGSAEAYRWFGSPSLSVQAGYRFTRIDFHQNLSHGYFSPDEYQSHLGLTGVRFRIKRVFHAQYLARAGVESIAQNAPFQTAWELSLRNWFTFGRCEIGAEYYHLDLVQNSGAFVAHGGTVYLHYRF